MTEKAFVNSGLARQNVAGKFWPRRWQSATVTGPKRGQGKHCSPPLCLRSASCLRGLHGALQSLQCVNLQPLDAQSCAALLWCVQDVLDRANGTTDAKITIADHSYEGHAFPPWSAKCGGAFSLTRGSA